MFSGAIEKTGMKRVMEYFIALILLNVLLV